MEERQHKFIIGENGFLRLGYVLYHKHLLYKGEYSCYGGGVYEIDHDKKTIILSGSSSDYGQPMYSRMESFDPDYYDSDTLDFIDLTDYTIVARAFDGHIVFEKPVKKLIPTPFIFG